jgi:hypothetical protein
LRHHSKRDEPQSDADRLRALSLRVARLQPDRLDPEKFHIEKSELAYELRRIARAMEQDAA